MKKGDKVRATMENSPVMEIIKILNPEVAKCMWFDKNQQFHVHDFRVEYLSKV